MNDCTGQYWELGSQVHVTHVQTIPCSQCFVNLVLVEQLAGAEVDELRLIGDGSDLRKWYASEMPALMQVWDLDRGLVSGYRH